MNNNSSWIQHFIIRTGAIVLICFALLSLSYFDLGMKEAYIMAIGIGIVLGTSIILLSIEAVLLLRKKNRAKLFCNIIIIILIILSGLVIL